MTDAERQEQIRARLARHLEVARQYVSAGLAESISYTEREHMDALADEAEELSYELTEDVGWLLARLDAQTQELKDAEAAKEQLIGDIRAITADYMEEKQRREAAEGVGHDV